MELKLNYRVRWLLARLPKSAKAYPYRCTEIDTKSPD